MYGNYYFVETIDTISEAFACILGELVSLIASDVLVEL